MQMATVLPSAPTTNPNEAWRNYNKGVSLHSCKLSIDDPKRLYRIINEKQKELGDVAVAGLKQTADETPEAFQERRNRVRDAYITTARITGFDNEMVTGHGESIFDSALLPERIMSIEYDTVFSPMANLNVTPNNRVVLLIDFSRPTVFGRGLPAEPTPNNSNWAVSAESEAWSTSLNARLEGFFKERRTHIDWLHRSNTYDALLLVIGVPLTLWATSRIGNAITFRLHLASAVQTALYIYLFFLFLNVFRWMFSYGRWVFPKIELESRNSAPSRHRAVWSALVFGILVAAIWDAIKALAAN
jgi:hypothetical protein